MPPLFLLVVGPDWHIRIARLAEDSRETTVPGVRCRGARSHHLRHVLLMS